MKINEIILVTENRKGTETNALMTFPDFLKFIGIEKLDSQLELAEIMTDLGRTLGLNDEWEEIYFMANKSISARYCTDQRQLGQFLQGYYNSTDQKVQFDEMMCSEVCLNKLKAIGMDMRGAIAGMGLHYEKKEARYEQGQILHNFNGRDYRVMEKLSARNLLLMDVDSGNFTVAIGTDTYIRHPSSEAPTENNCVTGIEWGHGVYLGSTPSVIDFRYLRQEYGTPQEIESLMDYRDMLEERFKLYNKLAKDELVSDRVKEVATNAMYEEFGTGKLDVFRERMDEGRYDEGFTGREALERGRAL